VNDFELEFGDLLEPVLIEARTGEDADRKETFAAAKSVLGYVERGQSRVVRGTDGRDVIANPLIFVGPAVSVTAQSRITVPADGKSYRVIDVRPERDPEDGQLHHYEVACQ
jgi:hypothetical protein